MLAQNKTEKDRMYEWALRFSHREGKQVFTKIDFESESYWNIRGNSDTYLMEYKSQTLTDYSECLQKMWEEEEAMQEILKTVLVAIMKNEPSEKQEKVQSEKKQEGLPEYIYNF